MGRLQSLQMLRFVAALSVVICHAWGMTHGRHNAGSAGVDMFFVISGFIVSLTARAKPEGFLKNRLIRVLPMYYLASLPLVLWPASQGALDPLRLLSTLTLWPAYATWALPYLDVSWSLTMELVFYLSLAAIAAGARPWVILSGYAACWLGALVTDWPVFNVLGSPLVLEFLMGVGIGLLPLKSPKLGGLAVALGVVGFVALGIPETPSLLLLPVFDPSALPRVAYWGVPAALIVYGALQLEPYMRGPAVKALSFLGDASYSLYLTHLLVMAFVFTAVPGASVWLLTASAVLMSVAAYLGLERPMLQLMRAPRRLRPSPGQA